MAGELRAGDGVLLLLADGFEELEAAAFIDVLGWLGELLGQPVPLVRAGAGPVATSAMGSRLVTDCSLNEVDPAVWKVVALPGGFHGRGYRRAYEPEILDILARVHGGGGLVATICVGAVPAAAAGLLHGRKATTWPGDDGRYIRELERWGAIYTGARVEEDQRVITGCGPSAALAVAFRLVAAMRGEETAAELRRFMRME